jgi:hypothetical protein
MKKGLIPYLPQTLFLLWSRNPIWQEKQGIQYQSCVVMLKAHTCLATLLSEQYVHAV